jgi:type IV pilus assembly protein PilM
MPSTVVGLDIGRTAVRAVELRQRGREATLRRHGSVPLPRGTVESGVVADPDEVTDACRRLWKEGRFSSREVRLGISSGSVLVRQIELDWMPPADLKRALRYQVADLLPVAVDDANLDHVLLGETTRTDETGQPRRMVRILLVATARGAVDELVRAVRAAGLRPTTADLVPLALVRAAAAVGREAGPSHTEAVIDIGADKVAVAVHTDGTPHFVRVVAGIGGDGLTQALATTTGLPWDEAERLKHGAAREHEPTLRAAAARLVQEIGATLDFWADSDRERQLRSVVLTGAGGTHPAFAQECARTLGLPVTPLTLGSLVDGAVSPGRRKGDAVTAAPSDDLVVPAALCLGVPA